MPLCLQQHWYPKQESRCFTAAWQKYSTAEPWSDPELASLRLGLAGCKAPQISWTPEAKAQGTALAWFTLKLRIYEVRV